ncbi:hypothetical protein E4U55_004524 [Claviceps digitariae]|nr:hypothetical protein E4U55_004524 [Claviceps digitariae]
MSQSRRNSNGSASSVLSTDSLIEELKHEHGEMGKRFAQLLNTMPEFRHGYRSILEARKHHSDRAKERAANGKDGHSWTAEPWAPEMRNEYEEFQMKDGRLRSAQMTANRSLVNADCADDSKKSSLIDKALDDTWRWHQMGIE